MLPTAVIVLVFLAGVPSDTQSSGPACHSISLRHEILSKEIFEAPVGAGLKFRLYPIRLGPKGQLNGWRMEIVSEQGPTSDFIYPVNPPLRFNGVQIFGANYGDDTKASLAHPHIVRFLLRQEDFDRLKTPLENALWPYYAPNPDRAGPDYLQLLKTVTTGQLVVRVLSYTTEPGTDSLRRMKFGAEFTAPQNFQFAPEFKAKQTTCPPDS